MSHDPLWKYLAPGDRETVLTSVLGWLLDPKGDHRLGSAFARAFFQGAGLSSHNVSVDQIELEASSSAGRADVVVTLLSGAKIAIEAKSRSTGRRKQLRKYAERYDKVIRFAPGHWNFPEFGAGDARFPIVPFSSLPQLLKDVALEASPYEHFITSWANALAKEAETMRAAREIVRQGSSVEWPDYELFGKRGDRYLSSTFARWVAERLKEEFGESRTINWKAQKSGVWVSVSGGRIAEDELGVFRSQIRFPGPLYYWLHLEFPTGKNPITNDPVAILEVRISEDAASRREIWRQLTRAKADLLEDDIRLAGKRPSAKNNYWCCMRTTLNRADLRDMRGTLENWFMSIEGSV